MLLGMSFASLSPSNSASPDGEENEGALRSVADAASRSEAERRIFSAALDGPLNGEPQKALNKIKMATPVPNRTLQEPRSTASPSLEVFDVFFGSTKEQADLFSELMETENTYVEWLRVIVIYFLQPITMSQNPDISDGAPLLSKAETNAIFSNVQQLLRLNDELLDAMKKQMEIARTQPGLELAVVFHNAFKHVLPYFKLYSVYINNYPTSVKALQECTSKNKAFAAFLDQAEQNKAVMGGRRLGDLLIMPVQRLCKYPLFFRQILKKMHKEHVSYKTLEETALAVEKLAEAVNKRKANAEGAVRTFEIANRLTGLDVAQKEMSGLVNTYGFSDTEYFQILAPGRALIAEAPCANLQVFEEDEVIPSSRTKKISRRKSTQSNSIVQDKLLNSKRHLRHLFVFSDVFLVSKAFSGGDHFDYRMWLELEHMTVCALPLVALSVSDPSIEKENVVVVEYLRRYHKKTTRVGLALHRTKVVKRKKEWYYFEFDSCSRKEKFEAALNDAIGFVKRSRSFRASSLNARGLKAEGYEPGRAHSASFAHAALKVKSPRVPEGLKRPMSAHKLPVAPVEGDEPVIFDLSPDKVWKENDDDWECARCTFHNAGSTKICSMCGCSKPWVCGVCTFLNEAVETSCKMCQSAPGVAKLAQEHHDQQKALAKKKSSKSVSPIVQRVAKKSSFRREKKEHSLFADVGIVNAAPAPSRHSRQKKMQAPKQASANQSGSLFADYGMRTSHQPKAKNTVGQSQTQRRDASKRRSGKRAADSGEKMSSKAKKQSAASPNQVRAAEERWGKATLSDSMLVRKWFGESLQLSNK